MRGGGGREERDWDSLKESLLFPKIQGNKGPSLWQPRGPECNPNLDAMEPWQQACRRGNEAQRR